jgi:hypothetical protein
MSLRREGATPDGAAAMFMVVAFYVLALVRKRGKRLPRASRRYARLPNARTLISLAHSLLAR